MFDHYLQQQKPDPRRQKLLGVCTGIATFATAMGLCSVWVSGKLSVYSVAPPSMNFVMVQMNLDEAPPPPPPPPPPVGSESQSEDDEPVPDEPVVIEKIQSPTDSNDKIPHPKPRANIPGASRHGIPGGTGPLSGIGSTLGLSTGLRKAAPAVQARVKPLSSVMAHKVYQPPSPTQALLETPTGRFQKRPGSVTVSFCISTTGQVINTRIKRKFPGDPAVDKIMLQWLRGFRFRPFVVDNQPRKICTEYRMNVRFR